MPPLHLPYGSGIILLAQYNVTWVFTILQLIETVLDKSQPQPYGYDTNPNHNPKANYIFLKI